MGYGPEEKSTVLELTYNYGVTKYDKGDAYAQVETSSPFPLFQHCQIEAMPKL
jgi:hypothetical protein